MNARIVVAQANSTPVGNTPAQVIHVVKPQAGHTVIFHASFDGSVKIDFSAIANEKITFYHDNADQSLHIIFADGSQAIIEPFFDSKGVVLGNLTIEVAPGQDLDGAQFAAQFPVTDDQSVLPAAGNGGNASGADFHDPSVDPLSVPGPLGLLGPEELPPIQFNEFTNPAQNEIPLLHSVAGTVGGVVEEEQLSQEISEQPESLFSSGGFSFIEFVTQGNEDPNDVTDPTNGDTSNGLDKDTNSNFDLTTQFFHGTGANSLSTLFTGGQGTLTFFIDSAVAGSVVLDANGHPVMSGGKELHYSAVETSGTDTTIFGGTGHGENFHPIFELTIHANGDYDFTLLGPIDQPDHTVDNGSTSNGGLEETLFIDFTSLVEVHDGGAPEQTAHLTGTDQFTIGVIDDTPEIFFVSSNPCVTVVEDETPGVQYADDDTTSSSVVHMFASVHNKGHDPDVPGFFKIDGAIGYAESKGALIEAFGSFGADGPAKHHAVAFSLTLNGDSAGVDSGLQTTEGHEIFLFQEGNLIVGRYDTHNSEVSSDDPAAFALAIDSGTGQVAIAQYVSLFQDSPDVGHDSDEFVSLASGTVSTTITITDGDGDEATQSADISNQIRFEDDGPTVCVSENEGFKVVLDETPGLQSPPNGDDNDTLFASLPHQIRALFNGVADKGNDPDVTHSAKDHGALGFAISNESALDVHAIFGADGPAKHGSEVFSLTLNGEDGVYSGIKTTEGDKIYLFDENGVIVGRVGGEEGKAAFAIAIDNDGHVATAEWLSLFQDSADPNGDIDEAVRLKAGLVSATVTITDGDGDTASASADISHQIKFEDDGPTVSGVTQFGSNLIVNGSFEQGHHDLGSSDWNIYQSIPGWTWGSDHIPFEVQTGGIGGLAAEKGNALIELDGDTTGNPDHTPQGAPDPNGHTDATIQQTIAGTEAGQVYELTFWYAPRPDHSGGDDSGLNVLWNGQVVYTIDSTNQPDGWQKITIDVTGTGPNDVLGFQGTGAEDEFGALLDNVSLRAVNPILDDEDTQLNGQGIQGGPGDDGHGVMATGKIEFNAGADGLKSIEVHGIDNLQAIYVDANGIGHPETVQYQWTPDGSGGGTLTGYTTDLPQVFTFVVDSNGHYTFTLIAPLDHPGHDDPNQDGTQTSFEDNLLLNFGVTVTDGDNDQAHGTIVVNVDDDSPTLSLDTNSGTVVIHDETPGLQSANGANDTAFSSLPSAIQAAFNGIVNKGFDFDIKFSDHDHGAIGYAVGAQGLVQADVHFGADGEAASNGEVFALSLPNGNGTFSGLYTTSGQEIYLFLENGVIVGRIDADHDLAEDSQPGHFAQDDQHDPADAAAFAITVDPATGQVYVAQYLSLEHFSSPDANGDISEPVWLASGTLSLSVTATDGDGDSVTQAADVSGEIKFLDDGPAVTVSEDRHFSVVLDETPGPQSGGFFGLVTRDGDDNDTLFHSFLGIGGLPSEVQAAFDSVQNTGNDPDVSSTPIFGKDYDDLGRGALGFAISDRPALDIHAVFGADGPKDSNHNGFPDSDAQVFSLTLNGVSGQVDSGIATTDGHEIYLTLENGVIVGRVLADGHTSVTTDDQAAFAIAIDDDGRVATAEWLSLHQNSADPNGDIDESVQLASGTVSATVTITDGDGDTASDSADISGQIKFEDDGPSVNVSQAQTGEGQHDVTLSQLTLDESIHQLPGDTNATGDNVSGVTAPTLLTTPNPAEAIGIVSTPTSSDGTSVADLFNVNVNFGADGPDGQPVYAYSFTLKDDHGHVVQPGSETGVETNLVATQLEGTALQGTTDAQRTIYLFEEADGSIVGRLGDNADGDIALRILITGSPSDPQITVEQYLPIEHPITTNPDDPAFLTFDDRDASLGITLTVTATDGDLDTDSDSKTITLADSSQSHSFIQIQDDGPAITSAFASGTIVQDETPGVQDGSDPNPANDVVGADLPTGVLALFNAVTNPGVDPDVVVKDNNAIGFATSAGSIVQVTPDFGTDGPAISNATVLSLAIGGGNGASSGLFTTDGHAISLFLENGLIVGRYDGNNDGHITDGANHSSVDPAAFAIALGQDGSISLAQYVSLKNPDAGSSAADQDEPTAGLKNIQAVVTVTDGDGDHASKTIDISSNIAFQDDGPTLTVTAPAVIDGLDFGNDFVINNSWGAGSGIDSGTLAGGWTIADANDGHTSDLVPNTGNGTVQLERVGDGYEGMHSSNNGFMVDLDASPHDIKISQVVNGLADGQVYDLRFEAGAPFPGEAHLEVWFGGQLVLDLAPNAQMTAYDIQVTGGSGPDHNNLLEFRETGTPDNQGTYLANVSVGEIVIDETAGNQPNTNDVDPNNLFDDVAHKGTDPDMPGPQFAAGISAVVSVDANFGADGPQGGNAAAATVYSLSTVGGNSGLTTTAGQEIDLFNETYNGVGYVVGRYNSNGDTTIDANDDAAFAFRVDPTTGVLSLVQYVSLHQGDTASNNEGVFLSSGTLSVTVTVTVTDGDGDTATQSADISANIRFDDDGPTALDGSVNAGEVFEDGLTTGNPEPPASQPTVVTITHADLTALVNFGADGPGTFGFNPVANGTLSGLSSDGSAISYQISGGMLSGVTADSRTIFTLVDNHDGTFTFTLLGNVDHLPLNSGGGDSETLTLNLASLFTATDGDGDSVVLNGGLNVTIENDIPVVTTQTNLIVNGSFEHGHDDLGNGQFSIYHSLPGWTTADIGAPGPSGDVPFEIQVGNIGGLPAEDGNAKVELDSDFTGGNLSGGDHFNDSGHTNATIEQHVAGTEAGQTYELTFWYSPRPDAGNPDSSSMDVLWNGAVVKSIDSTGINPGFQQITLFVEGTGDDTLAFQGTGQENTLGAYIDNVSLIAAAVVDEDGLPAGNNDSQPGDIVVPNADGDNNEATATGLLDIKWGADNGDGGADTLTANGFQQDGALATLTGRSVTFDAVHPLAGVSGTLTPGVLTSHGDAVTLSLIDNNTVLVGTAQHGNDTPRTVFEVSLSDDNSGAFRVVLDDALDHATDSNENNITLSFNYTATDSDGDSVPGSFQVLINDDMPVANNDVDTLGKGDEITGNVITGAGADSPSAAQDHPGADGGIVSGIASGNLGIPVEAGDNGTSILGQFGELTIHQDGSYTYDRTSTAGGTDTFTYTLTDDDGDSTTAQLIIDLDAQNHPLVISGTVSGVVEEEELPGGNPDDTDLSGSLDTPTVTNVATGSFGSEVIGGIDGALTFAVTSITESSAVNTVSNGALESGGKPVLFHQVDATTLIGYVNNDGSGTEAFGDGSNATTVFTLKLTDTTTGAYTFTLDAPVDHPNPLGEDAIAIDLNGHVTVTDAGGPPSDTNVPLNASVTIIDDTPVASQATASQTLDDEAQTLFAANTGGTNDVTPDLKVASGAAGSLFSAGADGLKSIGFTDPLGLLAIYKLANGLAAPEMLHYATQTHADDPSIAVGDTVYTATGNSSGNTVFTLLVHQDGSYAFTLSEPLVSGTPTSVTGGTPGMQPASEETLPVTIGFTVTDGDNDSAPGSLTINVNDDQPTIANIQDAIMPYINNTQITGTWQPLFGADGPNATSAISVAMGAAPSGLTYTITDTHTMVSGNELFQVDVKSGSTIQYTFYEYSDFNASTQSGEMLAFTDAAHTHPFFELEVNANGTYNFHVDTNSLSATNNTSFDSTNGVVSGHGDYIKLSATGVPSFGSDPVIVPSSAFPLIIDGFTSGDTNPTHHTVNPSNQGMGLDDNNFENNETLTFAFFSQQSEVDFGVGKVNATDEHFRVTIWDQTHTISHSEDVTLADGTTLKVDAADWVGTGSDTFFNFYEVDVTNTPTAAGDDDKLTLTTVAYNATTTTTVSSTTLNFALGITDGDDDSFTSHDNLTVSLLGTGSALTGTSTPEVIAASSGPDIITGGTGLGDTVDYSNSGLGVTVNLTLETDSVAAAVGGGATGDTIKGIENVIGSASADTLTAIPGGSVLYGGGGGDTLTGGAGNDTLIGGFGDGANDTLKGNGGNDMFVLDGHSSALNVGAGGIDEIVDFASGSDSLFVDVADQALTIGTAATVSDANFHSVTGTAGADENNAASWTGGTGNEFLYNQSSHALWFSADGTGNDKIELAHLAAGVPVHGDVHTF